MYVYTYSSVCNYIHGLNDVLAQLECVVQQVTILHTQIINYANSIWYSHIIYSWVWTNTIQ